MRVKSRYRDNSAEKIQNEKIPAEKIPPEIKIHGVEAEPVAAVNAEIAAGLWRSET